MKLLPLIDYHIWAHPNLEQDSQVLLLALANWNRAFIYSHAIIIAYGLNASQCLYSLCAKNHEIRHTFHTCLSSMLFCLLFLNVYTLMSTSLLSSGECLLLLLLTLLVFVFVWYCSAFYGLFRYCQTFCWSDLCHFIFSNFRCFRQNFFLNICIYNNLNFFRRKLYIFVLVGNFFLLVFNI